MIKVKQSGASFDEGEFNDFQKVIGFQFPESFIHFLKANNGGVPESNIVNLKNGQIESFSIMVFFGTTNEINTDIRNQYELYRGRIPEGSIPICSVEGGNIVCLNIYNGTINLWDHDSELIEQEDLSLSLTPIANDFNEFLELINSYNPEEEDLSGYTVEEVWVHPNLMEILKKDNN